MKTYAIWFSENKNKRISHLVEIVNSYDGFESWNADFSSESLKDLGKWLLQAANTVKISEEKYHRKRAQVPDYIEIQDWDLTIKTRSILIDVGMYFGDTFINEHNNLKWEQYFSKKDSNNGHIVIKLSKMELNPLWLLYILGIGLAKKTKNENSLYDLFKTWEKYL